MRSPYRILPNSYKRKQKISNREQDLERPQLNSKNPLFLLKWLNLHLRRVN